MACMEHVCPKCGYIEFNNLEMPTVCPCCNTEMLHYFDE